MPALVFPSTLPGLTWPVDRMPNWDTNIQTAISGKQTRFINRIAPLYKYTLDFTLLRQGAPLYEFETMLGFYNQCYGGGIAFQYTDPDDKSVTAQGFGIGDGTSTIFQLVRTLGGFVEAVYAPTGSPQIYVAGVLQVSGYTIDPNFGTVTFTTAPTSGQLLTWTGSYNWWCNFEDTNTFSQFMGTLYELKKLTFMTRIF